MKNATNGAVSQEAFKQWVWSAPPNVGANDAVTLRCDVELFTTGWIALKKLANRKGWTLEKTIFELLHHCAEEIEGDDKLFLWRLLGEEEDRPAHVPDMSLVHRAVKTGRN